MGKPIKKTDRNKSWFKREFRKSRYKSKSFRKTFLIICEGVNTEPLYFKSFPVKLIEIECFGERAELTYNVTYDNNFTEPAVIYITNEAGAPFSADNLIAGNYSIEINDANGCRGAYAEFRVTEPEQLIVIPTITNIECASPGRIDQAKHIRY